jgi:hypothetical protein
MAQWILMDLLVKRRHRIIEFFCPRVLSANVAVPYPSCQSVGPSKQISPLEERDEKRTLRPRAREPICHCNRGVEGNQTRVPSDANLTPQVLLPVSSANVVDDH